jgi:capsule polysaccharide export protein KpsE/RkpR
MIEGQGPRPLPEREIDLVKSALVVWRRRRLVLGLWLGAVAGTLLVSLLLAKQYTSTALLLPPAGSRSTGILGSLPPGLLPDTSGLSLTSPFTPTTEMLVSILTSRTVAQAVVERFDLVKRYRVDYVEAAVEQLQEKMLSVTTTPEGAIVVSVLDYDPGQAAAMAEFIVQRLDELAGKYGISQAGRQRVFLTKQVERTKLDLVAAEDALRRFQEKNQAIVLPDQTRGAIEAAARIKGEIIAAEVQLQMLRTFATDANPDVMAMVRRLAELRRQLGNMQYGEENGQVALLAERRDLYVPPSRLPEVGLVFTRLLRDVKVQETLYTLLLQQLEQSRLAEARDVPLVQVLDQPVPAERHSKPRLLLNTGIAAGAGLLGAILVAFCVEHVSTHSPAHAGGGAPVHTRT